MIFVTDRTEEDVLIGNEKGRYTASDLNRVESNVKELARLARKLDMLLVLTTKTDWSRADQWMNATQAQRYLGNVKQLVSECNVTVKIPSTLEKMNAENANNIEKALQMVYDRIMATTSSFHYSGEFFAGEEYL